jgi:hypothetical protein
MSVESGMKQEFTGPGVWSGAELNSRKDWILHFSPAEIQEIDAMVQSLRERKGDITALTRADFSLPAMTCRFESIRSELEGGRGFALIRGLPVQRYSVEENRLLFWALAVLLGDPQGQDAAGNRIHSVTNTQKRVETTNDVRSFQTDDELTFHNDGGDAFMLLCLKTAQSGGMSKLVSVEKLYNEVLKRRPDLIEVLQQPFHFDTREQHPTGLKVQSCPILNFFGGRLSVLYKRRYLLAAQRFPEVPRLTQAQEDAVQLVETICNDPSVQLSFYMEPGDVQIANNYAVLHARTKYQDHDDPAERRHLFRAWVTLPNGRALPPAFALTREFRTSYLSRPAVHAEA